MCKRELFLEDINKKWIQNSDHGIKHVINEWENLKNRKV